MVTDILLFLSGIVVGSMNAIAGGGMLLGFPILLATGMPALVANVTSNIIVLPGQITSGYGYRKYIRKLPAKYLWLLLPCLVGAVIGANILRDTPSSRFEQLVPGLILVAVILFAFQPFLHFHLHRHIHGKAKSWRPLALVALALLPMAVYGGYFGAGFGFMMLAFLGFTSLHDIHQMNGLKSLTNTCIAVASIAVLANTGLFAWHHGLVMAVGAAIGGYAGSRLAQRTSTHAIRIVVISIGLVTAVYLGFRSY